MAWAGFLRDGRIPKGFNKTGKPVIELGKLRVFRGINGCGIFLIPGIGPRPVHIIAYPIFYSTGDGAEVQRTVAQQGADIVVGQ